MKRPLMFIAAIAAASCMAQEKTAPAAPASPAPAVAPASTEGAAAKPQRQQRRMRYEGRGRMGPDGRRHGGPAGRSIYGSKNSRGIPGVVVRDFGTTADGRKAKLFRVMGQGGLVADFSDHGARLVRLYAPDRDGNLADVTVGFNDVSGYEKYDRNFNATVGRFANRIAAGRFSLDGETYQLPLNWGPDDKRCCLHGGTNSMNFVIWAARPVRRTRAVGVEFTTTSPDGDQGFPGKMSVKVTHLITADNAWVIDYEASVEGKPCPINLTNHAYFNLKGIGSGDINDHVLQIFASRYTPVDAGMIPTGEILDVKGTPFDFLAPHVIGERVNSDHPQIVLGKGYDHNWVLDSPGGKLAKAAVLSEPSSGRYVETWTTEPGLQVYGGNVMSGGREMKRPVPNKTGGTLPWRGAIALETQHFPDSPNHENFPSTILKPETRFTSRTEYRFGTLPK
ncbi:MAG: galactose mutarotase [Kiritimatiellae bacterium]|nr:galactose mutarotase [Kiritimatiellia bacterium]